MKPLLEFLESQILVLDGAMGTSLAELTRYEGPYEVLNIEKPELVKQVHRSFLEAGSDAISTNSFGANKIKLSRYGIAERAYELSLAAAKIARQVAGDKAYVFGSMGSTGELIEPVGELSFDDAYKVFAEQAQALENGGCDAILLETFIDIQEARAALLAVKENTQLPVFVSLTFSENGRTEVSGTSPHEASGILEKMGAQGVGANCSLGPEQLTQIGERFAEKATGFVLLQPNAGIPVLKGGKSFYRTSPEDYRKFAERAMKTGINIIGGCCGSKPEHIRAIASVVKGKKPLKRDTRRKFFLCTPSYYLEKDFNAGEFMIVGERINPAGKKEMQNEIQKLRFSTLEKEAKLQQQAGAEVLDVNVSVPLIKEEEILPEAVRSIYLSINLPLSIDTTVPTAAERTLKIYPGRALLNSVSARRESLRDLLPIARRFGAAIVGLSLLDTGITRTVEEKLKAAEIILEEAISFGFSNEDIIFDPLVLTAATSSVEPALEAIKELTRRGLYTIVGLSNVSHGLPERGIVNRTFASMAIYSGLSAAILDPLDRQLMNVVETALFLSRRKETFDLLRSRMEKVEPSPVYEEEKKISPEEALKLSIVEGKKSEVKRYAEILLKKMPPYEIISQVMAPAMKEVGDAYSQGKIYLPNVLLSAEAMKEAFQVIEPALKNEGNEDYKKARVVMATVEGDVHDIGKNICVTLLNANGYEVKDLGVDVSAERILEEAKKFNADFVGLSCLMTTTLPAMERTVKVLKEKAPNLRVAIGGAVVTDKIRKAFGADIYSKEAIEFVRILDEIIEREKRRD